jgi:diguanylate cyclase (GGDEF)-like protein
MVDRARILVIEDDSYYRQILMHLLINAGFDVAVASDGLEGLAQVKARTPDVVLVDWMMPGVDGATVTRYLKADDEYRNIYVMIVTARGETDSRVAGLEVGADDYLVKPVENRELLARVRSGLRLRALQHELEEKNRQLEHLALTDVLTGLPNRRHFEQALERELGLARRYGHTLSLAIGDIDRFKDVNDRLGHDGGDAVLREVASRLRAVSRAEDFVARVGGEEFALVLPFTDHDGAVALAERARVSVGESPIVCPEGAATVTISLGVATAGPTTDLRAAGLIKQADSALYRAKNAGRDRVGSSGTL